MNLLSIILIGIGLAMDAFVVSLAKGICFVEVNYKIVTKMALIFGAFQGVMIVIGYFIGGYLNVFVEKYQSIIVFLIFIVLGGKLLYEAFKSNKEEEGEACAVDFREFTSLGFATSIDALAVGITFAMGGSSVALAAIIIGVVTFIICFAGGVLGTHAGQKIKNKYAEILGGGILIAMAFIYLL